MQVTRRGIIITLGTIIGSLILRIKPRRMQIADRVIYDYEGDGWHWKRHDKPNERGHKIYKVYTGEITTYRSISVRRNDGLVSHSGASMDLFTNIFQERFEYGVLHDCIPYRSLSGEIIKPSWTREQFLTSVESQRKWTNGRYVSIESV